MNSDGFQVVSYKKGRMKKTPKAIKITTGIEKEEDFNQEKCVHQISQCQLELQESNFWQAFISLLAHSLDCNTENCEHVYQETNNCNLNSSSGNTMTNKNSCNSDHNSPTNNFPCNKTAVASDDIEELVAYGIGSLARSKIARYQFALLQLTREYLGVNCLVYDPVLSRKELSVIENFGCFVIDRNEECKRKVCKKTLFFMPHCGQAMYNNLLWANWQALSKICIVGNAFSSYRERLTSKEFETSGGYIKNVFPYFVQHNIDNCFQYKDIFNDTSFMTFPRNRLERMPETLRKKPEEPSRIKNDVEIITAQNYKN